jgi:putative flippase GtrA
MNQGKRQQQIKDSENIAMFAIIGLIVTMVATFVYNLITTL